MSSSGVKLVFGGGAINPSSQEFSNKDGVDQLLKALEEEKITTIDTAQLYPGSEKLLGDSNAASRFIIDTKFVGGFQAGSATKENIQKYTEGSLKSLQTDSVDIYYIHAPDRQTPLKETLAAIDEQYKAGKFKRFGLSNFTAEEVEEVVRLSKENGWVLPTVYQGNYSAVARKQESTLFPVLRANKIALYAYSPSAGGFLAKSKEDILKGAGRFNTDNFLGQMYSSLYKKGPLLEALDKWGAIAESLGISRAELAYRWVAHNSVLKPDYGDAVIIGAKNMDQLRETVNGIRKGPLSDGVVKQIDDIWKTIEDDAPIDNYNSFAAQG